MGTELPLPKGAQPPIFGQCLLWPTAGWTKMPLGMEVGLGPGEFVFDGDPATPEKRAHHFHPIFGPCLLWPNGWIDQDATWYGGKPRPRRRCVRWGSQLPPKRAHRTQPSVFGSCLLWPNGWIDENTNWYGSRPDPGHIVLEGSQLYAKGAEQPPPQKTNRHL